MRECDREPESSAFSKPSAHRACQPYLPQRGHDHGGLPPDVVADGPDRAQRQRGAGELSLVDACRYVGGWAHVSMMNTRVVTSPQTPTPPHLEREHVFHEQDGGRVDLGGVAVRRAQPVALQLHLWGVGVWRRRRG